MEKSTNSKLNIKENELIKAKKESLKKKKLIKSNNNNFLNNSLSDINNITPETPTDNNNFSLITNLNVNKSTLTDINKINEYKKKYYF